MEVEMLIPIALFLAIFGILYIYFTTRNKERMALIEKGADANMFNKCERKGRTLKQGMLLVGVAIGLLLGNVLYTYTNLPEEAAVFSMIFLFGGLALIAYTLIEKKIINMEE